MKVAKDVLKNYETYNGRKVNSGILPLIEEAPKKIPKNVCATHKLHSIQGDNTSTQCDLTVAHINESSALRQAIQCAQDLETIFASLNLTAGASRDAICRSVLREGPSLACEVGHNDSHAARWQEMRNAAYRNTAGNQAAKQAAYDGVAEPNRHVDDVAAGIRTMIKHMAPVKALEKVKRYLRRDCRKPSEMKIREWHMRMMKINLSELPRLPPFGRSQSLSNYEVIDIILHSIPNSWEAEMARQGFDSMIHSPIDVIEFCERIENLEDFEPVQKNSGKLVKKNKTTKEGKGKCCALHGNVGHSTEECRTIQAMKKKEAGNPPSKNKTWTRKASDAEKKARKDLATFVRKQVKAEMEANMTEESSKRKLEDGDEDEDLDLNLMDFNYGGDESPADDDSFATAVESD